VAVVGVASVVEGGTTGVRVALVDATPVVGAVVEEGGDMTRTLWVWSPGPYTKKVVTRAAAATVEMAAAARMRRWRRSRVILDITAAWARVISSAEG
jgi:hypothetical protein